MSSTKSKRPAATSTVSHRVILYGGLAVGVLVAIILIKKLKA